MTARTGTLRLGGLVVTVLVHAGGACALLLAQRAGPAAAAPPPRSFVAARLVRLGKPRDPTHLPRIPTAAPPTAAPTPIAPSAEPSAAAPAAPTPRPDPGATPADAFRAARLRALQVAQARDAEEAEGLPTGSPHGTADTAAEGDPYATAIDEAIRREWRLPDFVTPEQVAALACEVLLRLAPDGRILEQRLVRPSGNRFLDASVVEALARLGALPPPPPDRLALLREGVVIVFRP